MWIIKLLLTYHLYIGPVYSQSNQVMQPNADGAPISFAPILGSKSGANVPDGVIINYKNRF